MADEKRDLYRSLKHSRGVLVLFSYVALIGMEVVGAVWFVSLVMRLFTATMTDSQRLNTIIVAVVILLGFVLGGVILYRVIRSMADVIEVLMDTREEARHTGQSVEHQLLPLVNGLERLVRMPEAERAKRWEDQQAGLADDELARAHQAVLDAVQREYWHQAEKLAKDLCRRFPASPQAERIAGEIAKAKQERRGQLFDQVRAAGRRADWDALGRVRDRLVAFASDAELPPCGKTALEMVQEIRERKREYPALP